jgi:hypothetical protein
MVKLLVKITTLTFVEEHWYEKKFLNRIKYSNIFYILFINLLNMQKKKRIIRQSGKKFGDDFLLIYV